MSLSQAIVFAGGGGKGAFQIGVWEALVQCGLDRAFNCVIGTSVGALNGALFSQGNLTVAKRVWQSISQEVILPIDLERFSNGGAIATQRNLESLLRMNLRPNGFRISTYVCCSRVLNKSTKMPNSLRRVSTTFAGLDLNEDCCPEYIRLNDVPTIDQQIKYLLASSALPIAYDAVEIDGAYYRDGGILELYNFPYQRALDLGYQKVLAISLEQGVSRWEHFDGQKIFFLHPFESLGNLVDGTIDFNPANVLKRINMGYETAKYYQKELELFREETSYRMSSSNKRRIHNILKI